MIEGKRKPGTAGERTEDAESAVPTKSTTRSSRPVPSEGFVYFIEAERLGLVKIGWGADAARRMSQLQVGSPDRLILLGALLTDDPVALEKELHETFSDQRVHGEWFKPSEALSEIVEKAKLYQSISTETVKVMISRRQMDGVSFYRRLDETTDEFMERFYREARAMGLMEN